MWKKCDRYISGWSEIVVAREYHDWKMHCTFLIFCPRGIRCCCRETKKMHRQMPNWEQWKTRHRKRMKPSRYEFSQLVDFFYLFEKFTKITRFYCYQFWRYMYFIWVHTIFVFQGYESNEGYHSHEQKRLSQQCIIAQKELKVGLLSRPAHIFRR